MSLRLTMATTRRIIGQLRRDHRTLALVILLPALLMVLMRYVLDSKQTFEHVAPTLLAIFPFIVMFLVTSVATLRERRSGTLERLMTMPIAKLDLLLGYAIAFGAFAVIQVGVVGRPLPVLARAGRERLARAPARHRRSRRPARDGAGSFRQRLCPHRISGRPGHAAVRRPSGPAQRAVRASRPHGRFAHSLL